MSKSDLNIKFQEAFERLSNADVEFAPDVLLTFFALYKQANQNNSFSTDADAHELISAFKMNAILQVKDMTPEDAKRAYIEKVNEHLDF